MTKEEFALKYATLDNVLHFKKDLEFLLRTETDYVLQTVQHLEEEVRYLQNEKTRVEDRLEDMHYHLNEF